MKRIIFILFSIIPLLGFSNFVYAAQLNGTPVVTEQKVTAQVNTNDPTGVILEIYDDTNARVAGPTTTTGSAGIISATIDVNNLKRNTTYTLKGKDKNSNSGGDVFSITINTVSADTRVTGTGNWYYSSDFEVNTYYDTERVKSYHRFTTEALCKDSWQKAIDDYYNGKNTGGLSRDDLKYTTCFTLATFPSKSQFLARMNPPYTFESSVDIFYYTWWYGNTVTDWKKEGPFETNDACKNSEGANIYIIIKSCEGYKKPPVQPVDWERIRQESYNAHSQFLQSKKNGTGDSTYTLLAPIGDLKTVEGTMDIGRYINLMFKIFLGLCGALAVIMIIIYGIQWMGTDSVFGKTEAKSNIGSAIGGLLLALSAWILLNTINPDLLGGTIYLPNVNLVLTEDEENFSKTEGSAAEHPGYIISGTSFESPLPSPGVQNLADKLKLGYKITQIHVYPNAIGTNKNRTFFLATKAGSPNVSAIVNSGNGTAGFSEVGKAEANKTPRGQFKIGENDSRMEVSTSTEKAILTRNQKSNMGAAFIGINALNEKGENRRIGFHGNWNNNELAGTNGCIRMKNDDLILLAPYMIRDLPTVIILE